MNVNSTAKTYLFLMLGILSFPDKEFLVQENLNINSTVKCIYS